MKRNPKVTLFVYAYNHENFIGNAIDAALSQSYSNLEIILSDDNSTDRTFEIMQEKAQTYDGPHKLILNKNESNLGISGHLNKIMTMGSGDWFVLAAGDDISFPNRVEMIFEKIKDHPEIMSMNSGFDIIDQNGHFKNYQGFCSNRLYVMGATGAWNRKIFDFFGPITQPTTAEDVVIPFRALLLGKIFLLNSATIFYREHDKSVSSPSNIKNIDAQKHLKKICFQLVNACEQRLLDLDKVRNEIEKSLYISLKKKHQDIIVLLHARIENIEKTINMLEVSFVEKIKYIFTSSPLKNHNSIMRRIKQVLLSFRLIEVLNKKRRQLNLSKSYITGKDGILLDLKQLDNQKDLLIYL